jgi:hypothetical protein
MDTAMRSTRTYAVSAGILFIFATVANVSPRVD